MADPRIQFTLAIRSDGAAKGAFLLEAALSKDGQLLKSDQLPLNKRMIYGMVQAWLLQVAKPLFYELLPAVHLEVKIPEAQLKGNPIFAETLRNFRDAVVNTNHFLLEHGYLKGMAASHDRVLFYNPDGHEQFEDLYNQVRARDPERFLMKRFNMGYNREKDAFIGSAVDTPGELVELILSQRIKRIVSINMYYCQIFLENHKVHPCALLRFMGAEFVMLDYDIYDLTPPGYLFKAAWTCPDFGRYSVYPHVQRDWDEMLGAKPVKYATCFRTLHEGNSFKELNPDYDIAFLSHSRVKDVILNLNPILFITHHLREESLFDDFQLWYYALRERILAMPGIELSERMRMNTELYFYYLATNSFLKFEAIDGLKVDRKIRIFGDTGWKEYFPDYFQDRYLNAQEKRDLFRDGRALHLLVNANYSYLECNPAVYEPMHLNVPYLAIPAVTKIPELEGLGALEYRSLAELNRKAADIAPWASKPEFHEALSRFKRRYQDCGRFLVESLEGGSPPETAFREAVESHWPIAKARLAEYAAANAAFLQASVDVLLMGKPTAFSATQSRYYPRDYVQKMVRASKK